MMRQLEKKGNCISSRSILFDDNFRIFIIPHNILSTMGLKLTPQEISEFFHNILINGFSPILQLKIDGFFFLYNLECPASLHVPRLIIEPIEYPESPIDR
jgi:hypothetical protein